MHILENKNIKLRSLEPNDLDELFDIENDTSLWDISNTHAPYSRDLLSKYLEESAKDIYEAKQLRLVVSPIESDELIGLVDLFQFEPHHRRAGVGIIIKKEHQGKGVATQAVELMTQYAFKFLGLHQLFAHIPLKNPGSRQLFEKAGFSHTGTLKEWTKDRHGYSDVLIYQLLNPERKLTNT